MACERYQELISTLLDGELSPAERAELTRHLSGCAECAALYAAFSGLSASLAEDLVEPPECIRENVMATLRREEMFRRNRRQRRVAALAGMAACLALAVGLSLRAGLLSPARRAAVTEDSAAYAAAEAPMARGESAELFVLEDAAEEEAGVPNVERAVESAAEAESAPEALNSYAAPAPAQNAAADKAATRAQTVHQAAGGSGQTVVTVDQGIMRLDLSAWLSRETLLAFLGGSPIEEDAADSPVLLCRITVSDGGGRSTFWLYGADRALLYRIPGVGLYRADCNWASLLSFLSQGGSS